MGWKTGYKAFNRIDKKRKSGECLNFVYEEGKTYKIEGELSLCNNGFHACKDLILTSEYYDMDLSKTIYAEVEFIGECVYEEPTKHKAATSEIKILRFLSNAEVLEICGADLNNSGHSNSGHRNSGHRNSGHSNSGDWNSGHSNSGDWNSGHSNSGDWNSCDRESGFFNTEQPETIRVFNKPCLLSDWQNADKPNFLYFDIDAELGYKGSFQKSFESASKREIEQLKALPNFNADVFYELSGIRIDE